MFFVGHALGFKLVFWFGPELVGPFATLRYFRLRSTGLHLGAIIYENAYYLFGSILICSAVGCPFAIKTPLTSSLSAFQSPLMTTMRLVKLRNVAKMDYAASLDQKKVISKQFTRLNAGLNKKTLPTSQPPGALLLAAEPKNTPTLFTFLILPLLGTI